MKKADNKKINSVGASRGYTADYPCLHKSSIPYSQTELPPSRGEHSNIILSCRTLPFHWFCDEERLKFSAILDYYVDTFGGK